MILILIVTTSLFVVNSADRRSVYCKLLNVHYDAAEQEIEKAFRIIALKHHPDKNPHNVDEATVEFRQFVEARDYLLGKNLDPFEQNQKEWEIILREWEAYEIQRQKVWEEIDIIVARAKETLRKLKLAVNDTCEENNSVSSSVSVPDHASDHPTDPNPNAIDIERIKKEMKESLQKLKELNVDTDEYLLSLMEDTKHANPLSLTHILLLLFLFAILCKTLPGDDENQMKKEINKLLSRQNPSMQSMRKLIDRYRNTLGHIKTTGAGRTKRKIIMELTQFVQKNDFSAL